METNTWRGLGRLWRLLAHILAGFWIVYTRFPRLGEAERRATVQRWAAEAVRRCGITLQVRGTPAEAGPDGLMLVANHISWVDIPTIHAIRFCRFISKSEVKHWPVVGRLADSADTLYLQRTSRRDAHRVLHTMAERLQQGDVLAFFPEVTTSDGVDLLPFHANLLQAAISVDAPVQPVALQFLDAQGRLSQAPCYIGDDTLLESLWRTVRAEGVVARVTFGEPERAQGRSRQQWAQDLQRTVAELRR